MATVPAYLRFECQATRVALGRGLGPSSSLRRVDPLVEGFERYELDVDSLFSGTVLPVFDGFVVGGQPPNSPGGGCGDLGTTWRFAEVSTSGATRWVFDYEAEEFAASPTIDADGNLLAWGDCFDGSGAGVYVASDDGTIDATFSSLSGDSTFVVAGSRDLFVFEQDRDDGTLVVACVGEGSGNGGVFGLALEATSGAKWPLPHGNRRF